MGKQNKNINQVTVRQMAVPGAGIHLREAAEGEAQSRTITGYAILFGTPSAPLYADEEEEVREVIEPGAVTQELLDRSDIKFTMYHDRQILLGRSVEGKGTLSYGVDERGVSFELELPHSPNGDEALEMVRRGDITGCSFAFATRYYDRDHVSREETRLDDGRTLVTYRVKEILGIYDFTLASDPAYPATSVEARELYRSLRDIENPKPEEQEERGAWREQVAQMRAAAGKNKKTLTKTKQQS